MKKADLIIVLFLLFSAVLFKIVLSNSGKIPNDPELVIKRGDKIVLRRKMPFSDDIVIDDASGNLLWKLRMEGYKLQIIESSCPRHYCMYQLRNNPSSFPVVCLPNQLTAYIESGSNGKDKADAYTW